MKLKMEWVEKMAKLKLGRFILALLIGLALIGGKAVGGSAHAELVSSNPVDGSTVTGPVTSIFLTFGEGVKHLNDLTIKDQTGKTYKVKSIDYAGKNVTLNLDHPLNNGKVSLNWQSLSDDGHLAPGAMSFTLGSSQKNTVKADQHKTEARTSQKPPKSSPVITILLVALLVVIIIGFIALLRRKKR